MQTRKNANLAPESFRHSAVPRRLKHRARRRRRILCLLPVILVFGVLAAALLRFTPALAYADIFPAQASTRRIKDVPYISQLPTLPTGCESAGAAMLLNYYGCTVTAEEFASYYLPTGDAPHTDENGKLIGCDPWEAFPGDPFSETGWGCYSTVIERAMNVAWSETITWQHLKPYFKSQPEGELWGIADKMSIRKKKYELEQETIKEALEITGGNRSKAAELLQISRGMLYKKIKKYNM